MGFNHHFYRIRYILPAGQRITHAAVALADAVAQRNCIKFSWDSSRLPDSLFHMFCNLPQMDVSGHHLCKGIDDGYQRFMKVVRVKARAVQQRPVRGTFDSIGQLAAFIAAVFKFQFIHACFLLLSSYFSLLIK